MAPPTKAQLQNQIKQLKAAKKKAKPPPQPRAGNSNLALARLAHQACDVTNPFCVGSIRSKWPDGSSAYTIALPRRKRIAVTTNSNGSVAVVLSPSAGGFCDYMVGTLNNTTLIASFSIPDKTADVANYNPVLQDLGATTTSYTQSRTVSCGFSFTPTASFTDAKGSVSFIESNSLTLKSTGTFNFDASVLQRPTYYTVPLRNTDSTYIISRPSGVSSREFHDIGYAKVNAGSIDNATSTNSLDTQDWSAVYLIVQGGPVSQVVGFIDVYQNVEVTIKTSDTTMAPMLSPAPPMNNMLMKASQAMSRTNVPVTGTVDKVDKSFLAKAYDFLKPYVTASNIKAVGSVAAGYLMGGPMGGATAYAQLMGPGNPTVLEVD